MIALVAAAFLWLPIVVATIVATMIALLLLGQLHDAAHRGRRVLAKRSQDEFDETGQTAKSWHRDAFGYALLIGLVAGESNAGASLDHAHGHMPGGDFGGDFGGHDVDAGGGFGGGGDGGGGGGF